MLDWGKHSRVLTTPDLSPTDLFGSKSHKLSERCSFVRWNGFLHTAHGYSKSKPSLGVFTYQNRFQELDLLSVKRRFRGAMIEDYKTKKG